jgi:hypothetical protein
VVADTELTDENVTLGSRCYYVVRSVDAVDGSESVDSESVSIVPSAAATSLSGSGGSSSASMPCFISTAQEAFNQDIMNGLALLAVIILIGLLIQRRMVQSSGSKVFN